MHELISKLRGKVGLDVSDQEQSWEIRVPKEDGLVFQITVPHNVLEWYVSARLSTTGEEIWTDWNDYYAVTDETDAELRLFMRHDIERFVDRLLASPARVLRSPKSPKSRLEWRADDGWELVSIYEDVA